MLLDPSINFSTGKIHHLLSQSSYCGITLYVDKDAVYFCHHFPPLVGAICRVEVLLSGLKLRTWNALPLVLRSVISTFQLFILFLKANSQLSWLSYDSSLRSFLIRHSQPRLVKTSSYILSQNVEIKTMLSKMW
jgi:hypothetical protein